MRKPQNKFEILECNNIYFIQRNGKEQICPRNFDKRANCGSWCPFFAIRMDEIDGTYFYYVNLNCCQPGAQFKIVFDIILKPFPDDISIKSEKC